MASTREGSRVDEREWLVSQNPAAMLRLLDPGETRSAEELPLPTLSRRKLRLFACACARHYWQHLTNPRSREAVEVAEQFADGSADLYDLKLMYQLAPSALTTPLQWFDYSDLGWMACSDDDYQCSHLLQMFDGTHPLDMDASCAAILRDIVGSPFRPFVTERAYLTDAVARARVQAYAHEAAGGGRPGGMAVAGLLRSEADRLFREAVARCVIQQAYLTPDVLALAQAAYRERRRTCVRCKGRRYISRRISDDGVGRSTVTEDCPDCGGTGHTEGGAFDPQRLLILTDALEEAGCDSEPLLRHLRGWVPFGDPDRPGYVHWAPGGKLPVHYCGCWAVDLLLGKS
jgi:hypothetical protein